ncbi:hypothetical protein H6775_00755 [Candidatus Nomurabacteria bacterium]|nr:hypothetical protein [Candidatus Nomurabacteria bacterium]
MITPLIIIAVIFGLLLSCVFALILVTVHIIQRKRCVTATLKILDEASSPMSVEDLLRQANKQARTLVMMQFFVIELALLENSDYIRSHILNGRRLFNITLKGQMLRR